MRLIDADALKKALDEQMNFEENCRDSVFDIIDNAPTVTGIINAKDFKKRINNMEYIYLQDCAVDVLDAIDCEVTYFKEKMKGGTE